MKFNTADGGHEEAIAKMQELEQKEVSMPYYPPQNMGDETDPETQFAIGNKYYNGEGVARDYSEAVKWFRRAADKGNIDAQFQLGLMYETGKGVSDYSEALNWYRLAANQGNSDAQYNLGHMYARLEFEKSKCAKALLVET